MSDAKYFADTMQKLSKELPDSRISEEEVDPAKAYAEFLLSGITAVDESELDAIAKEEADRKKQAQVDDAIARCEMNLEAPKWWTLDTYKPSGQSWIGRDTVDFKRAIDAVLSGANLVVGGETNGGKSHLSCAIARELAKRGKTVMRLKDFDFAQQADIARYRENHIFHKLSEDAKKADLLIFDDIGKNRINYDGKLTYYGNVIFSIFDSRAEQRKQVIVTTRIGSKQLAETLGDDLLRRIRMQEGEKMGHVTILTGGENGKD